MAATRPCPFCAEEIHTEAIRCRYCRSRLVSFDIERWHRRHPEARLAGVCAALAHVLAVPVSLVRLAFIAFTIFLHIAPLTYAVLWMVIPREEGGQSTLERLLGWALDFAGALGGRGARGAMEPHLPATSPRRDASTANDDGPVARSAC
jgi:phage shock protein C